jgi:signal transduction histidine kinase
MARILLVDSDEPARASLREALRRLSPHELLEAADGATALDRLVTDDVDMVLLEEKLPEVDGFEVCRRVRADARTGRPPVVFLIRPQGGAESRSRALEMGAADVIAQPVEWPELVARIGSVLRGKARADGGGPAAFAPAQSEDLDREGRRLQSEKLASLGMLAAGVAHEINNPAAFVVANTEALGGLLRLIDEKLRDDGAAARKLGLKELVFEAMAIVQESKEGMARIQRIVRDLHAFSRVDDDHGGVTDVNVAIESALTMLRNELRYRAQVVRTLEATQPVRLGSARLGQVLLNLVINAAHALREDELPRNRITVRSYDQQDQVVIEVEDNGPGIAPEILPRVFEAFFTTKPAGLGTGLGLSITREIVRSAGGEIAAEAQPGRGALFRVRLPVGAGAPLAPVAAVVPARRRYRLMAIDDEPLLLRAYRRIFIDHHDIELCLGGADALALLETDRAFDVILCDLQMPELSGVELYHTICRRWPELERRFIVTTGGAFSPESRAFLEREQVECVNKPFQLEEILEVIDRRASLARDS